MGAKIDLLLRSERGKVRTNSELCGILNVQADYLCRLKNGTRTLSEQNLQKLCVAFGLKQSDWFEELEGFGAGLGYNRKQIALIARRPLPGLDFASRIKDRETVENIFRVMEGYWDSFYFSVSRNDCRLVSKDLMIVKRVNSDGFIECEIADGAFTYSGSCFPIKNHLYFILERVTLVTEIITYITNWPERQPPRLYGIILCLSGGIQETSSYPAAAKVAFRYLGRDSDVRRNFKLKKGEDVDTFLRRTVPSYLDPDTELDADMRQIVHDIDNLIPAGSLPSALRMTL